MEIENLKITNLRNEEHFQFDTEFRALVTTHTPAALSIEKDYTAFQLLFESENEALKNIRASSFTNDLADADQKRDETYRGMFGMVKTASNHFRDDVKQAGMRLHVVMDNFDAVASLPYDQETATLTHLLDNLVNNYAADLALTGIAEWADELRAQNTAFGTLLQTRYTESAVKTQVNLRATRLAMDAVYNRMVKRINALMLVNGEAPYKSFVAELNQRIQHYNNLLALRKGRNSKEPDAPETPTV